MSYSPKHKGLILKVILFTLISIIYISSAFSLELRVGDVIVQPLKCRSCDPIGSSNGTVFSHSLIVLETKPEIIFAEALGITRTLNMHFLKMRVLTKGNKNTVMRHKELDRLHKKSPSRFLKFEKKLQSLFYNEFEGLPFDHDYLWNNVDKDNIEKLYCSEFVTKILNPFLKSKIKTSPMDYTSDWDFWIKYFGHLPPQGLPGNSPSTFYLSKDFKEVGIIERK
jgi:hypothetical protein